MTTKVPKLVTGIVRTYSDETEALTHPEEGTYHLVANSGYSYSLALVECGGCGREFLVEGDSRAVWPLAVPPTPEGTPPKVAEAYSEARMAFAAGAPLAAILAARTTLYRMLKEQAVSKFKDLVPNVLTSTLYGGAEAVRLWADVGVHGDIEVGEFKPAEVEDLLNYMATVLDSVYTQPARVAGFAKRTAELEGKAPPPSKATKA